MNMWWVHIMFKIHIYIMYTYIFNIFECMCIHGECKLCGKQIVLTMYLKSYCSTLPHMYKENYSWTKVPCNYFIIFVLHCELVKLRILLWWWPYYSFSQNTLFLLSLKYIPHIKINLKWITDLNVKHKTIKFLKDNIEENVNDLV